MESSELAEALFIAYNAQEPNPWQTFDGRPVPTWTELSDQVRGKWIAAASRAKDLLTPQEIQTADIPAPDSEGGASSQQEPGA